MDSENLSNQIRGQLWKVLKKDGGKTRFDMKKELTRNTEGKRTNCCKTRDTCADRGNRR